MKNILIFAFIISLTSCAGNDEKICNCESQRFERTAVRATSSGSLISASEWVSVGSTTSAGADCDRNGSTNGFGSYNSYVIDGSRYGVSEFENKIICK